MCLCSNLWLGTFCLIDEEIIIHSYGFPGWPSAWLSTQLDFYRQDRSLSYPINIAVNLRAVKNGFLKKVKFFHRVSMTVRLFLFLLEAPKANTNAVHDAVTTEGPKKMLSTTTRCDSCKKAGNFRTIATK